MEKINKTDKLFTKIKATNDIEINGNVYFIPDSYIDNKFLPNEFKKLYKIMLAMYLDLQIVHNKIENITGITKTHIATGIIAIDKLISYIITGKIYITYLNIFEKEILKNIPESLIQIIDPNIIEKIE